MAYDDAQVEKWKIERLLELEFDATQITALLFWDVDMHDVWRLMGSPASRTSCTHAQALRILKPLDVFALDAHELHSVRVPA